MALWHSLPCEPLSVARLPVGVPSKGVRVPALTVSWLLVCVQVFMCAWNPKFDLLASG